MGILFSKDGTIVSCGPITELAAVASPHQRVTIEGFVLDWINENSDYETESFTARRDLSVREFLILNFVRFL